MKASIKFDMNGIEVFQDIECPNHTKEEVLEGLNNGTILTGINTGSNIVDIRGMYTQIGHVLNTDFEHDIAYTDFELND